MLSWVHEPRIAGGQEITYGRSLERHLKYFGLVDDGGKAITFSALLQEFARMRLKMLPKKGDLRDLNNWRGIMLLEANLNYPWDSRLIKGRHNGGLIYFGSSYKHCQHDLADH